MNQKEFINWVIEKTSKWATYLATTRAEPTDEEELVARIHNDDFGVDIDGLYLFYETITGKPLPEKQEDSPYTDVEVWSGIVIAGMPKCCYVGEDEFLFVLGQPANTCISDNCYGYTVVTYTGWLDILDMPMPDADKIRPATPTEIRKFFAGLSVQDILRNICLGRK